MKKEEIEIDKLNFFKKPMDEKYQKSSISILNKFGYKYLKVELEAQLPRINDIDLAKLQRFQEIAGTSSTELFEILGIIEKRKIEDILGNDLSYIRHYRDGSVELEITFTAPMSRASDIGKICENFYKNVKNFSNSVKRSGVYLPVNHHIFNAGMHVAIMKDSDYSRCCDGESEKERQLNDWLKRVRSSMLFLSSSSDRTRPINFRRFSKEDEREKYRSVNTNYHSLIEFRLFDPITRDGMFTNYLYVIAKTMEISRLEIKDPNDKIVPLIKNASSKKTIVNPFDGLNYSRKRREIDYIRKINEFIREEDKIKLINQLALIAPREARYQFIQFAAYAKKTKMPKNTILRYLTTTPICKTIKI